MGKKILLTLASAFLMFRFYELMLTWSTLPSQSLSIQFILAFLANLFILGAFALAGFAWPTYRLLPEKYYRISQPKELLSFSKNIGVPIFQRFLLFTFWRKKAMQTSYFNGTKSGIKAFITESKRSEFGHLIPFIIVSVLFIWSLMLKEYWTAIFLQTLNVIGNFYPILLQRSHRARTQRFEKFIETS
ncbi:hypothetical protein SAMN04489724_3801 [Algoriphagus locisalis]|uniref:Glycosyl-4,4'-diaponeurosporenoate acyltransferase n=1 Tax=Algoriphagus locisalis TaxID=305507 RepID=A0A1I7D9K9_9BACT|nr:hypothetical protein [Algoriphagus locisalis]SFU08351.1 hypothetical protein SAMN04489724_3801 [Algoriphagus locisalis]